MKFSRKEAHTELLSFLDKLDRREKAEFLLLTNSWEDVSSSIDGLIKKLSKLENLSEDQLYRLGLYKDFLQQARGVTEDYALVAGKLIQNERKEFALLGIEAAQSLLPGFYNKLPVTAINVMIANTKEGTPLFNLLMESYPQTVDSITKTLIESMALGRNPIETARLLAEDMDGNLMRALRIARTEQLNDFREAQTLQYQESGLVTGVDLVTEPNACEECLSEAENNPHDLGWLPDIHPNCRCGLAPVL